MPLLLLCSGQKQFAQPPFVVPCRMSELRAVELLEDLCEDMDDYTLYTNTSDSSAEPEWVKFRGEGAVSERTWWVSATEDHQLEVPVLIAMPASIRAAANHILLYSCLCCTSFTQPIPMLAPLQFELQSCAASTQHLLQATLTPKPLCPLRA